jgi:predicted amidophosphoribosyltransferase
MVFCKNCGKELPSIESVICPSCGVTQKDTPTTLVTLSPKNSGTTTIIALIAGFFGFSGVGHMYIGKTKFGIGIMLLGWLIGLIWIGLSTINPILAIVGIVSIIFWIWQAYDANKKAKYYNEYIKSNGKAPW